MNKKLLFGIMSFAALAACTNDDFESQQKAAKEVSPIQFELVNNGDATRASMSGNTVVWNANDGDLFTLYHGATTVGDTKGYENACYKAEYGETGATLSTPTMIKEGYAVMVWPVDTQFTIKPATDLFLSIPVDQTATIQNEIPHVSDQIQITEYTGKAAYNEAGKDRKYPVFMRPMASQLNLKANYGDTENELKKLYKGGRDGLSDEEAIEPITVTSVELLTAAGSEFTTKIPVKFTDPDATITAAWTKTANNNWKKVTDFDKSDIPSSGKQSTTLTTKYLLDDNKGCKFIMLPQTDISDGLTKGAVRVNTYYGSVLVAKKSDYAESKYSDDEYKKAWYRYVGTRIATETTEENASATTAEAAGTENAGKYKTVAKSLALGLQQTINFFSNYKVNSASSKVNGEPRGTSVSRYLNVNLKHLDMSALHIKTDKQLRDVARVWKKLGLESVTVYLDGGTTGKFTITQKTIDVINSVNPADPAEPTFKVKPCQDADHGVCAQIVITENSGNATVKDVDFIAPGDGAEKVEVVFANESTAWNWTGTVKVAKAAVSQFTNLGTLVNSGNATLKTAEYEGTQNNVPLYNQGTWNIETGKLFVQFSVYNYKTVNIKKGAEYRQSGSGHKFTNRPEDKPTRFGGDDAKIGTVNNYGVFATVDGGNITNVALINHLDPDAKTYITSNQGTSPNFKNAWGGYNKFGRINLLWSNKDEDNISVSSTLEEGFISVTVTSADAPESGALDASVVGSKVNYVIVNSGIKSIENMPDGGQIKYLEINDPTKTSPNEIKWNVTTAQEFTGLMVLSDVNIALGTTISATVTYLGEDATMYVGGKFNKASTDWNGYYGETTDNVTTNYVTY